VVGPERLHRWLRRVTDDLVVLRGYGQVPAGDLLGDHVRMGHVKYIFVTLLEGCIDAAHHVCAAEGWRPASNNADAMLVLARHGVLSSDQAGALAQAVRFRNVLVHGYADVDVDVDVDGQRVGAYLGQLKDIAAFVRRLTVLLAPKASHTSRAALRSARVPA
jgi:uncharacterized protein YutE (UPF0331/DUF86 family)